MLETIIIILAGSVFWFFLCSLLALVSIIVRHKEFVNKRQALSEWLGISFRYFFLINIFSWLFALVH